MPCQSCRPSINTTASIREEFAINSYRWDIYYELRHNLSENVRRNIFISNNHNIAGLKRCISIYREELVCFSCRFVFGTVVIQRVFSVFTYYIFLLNFSGFKIVIVCKWTLYFPPLLDSIASIYLISNLKLLHDYFAESSSLAKCVMMLVRPTHRRLCSWLVRVFSTSRPILGCVSTLSRENSLLRTDSLMSRKKKPFTTHSD